MRKKTLIIIILIMLGSALFIFKESTETSLSQTELIQQAETRAKIIASLIEVEEGVHYDELDDPLILPPHHGVVISEFFWFGCPHCQNIGKDAIDWRDRLSLEIPTIIDKVPVPGSKR